MAAVGKQEQGYPRRITTRNTIRLIKVSRRRRRRSSIQQKHKESNEKQ